MTWGTIEYGVKQFPPYGVRKGGELVIGQIPLEHCFSDTFPEASSSLELWRLGIPLSQIRSALGTREHGQKTAIPT